MSPSPNSWVTTFTNSRYNSQTGVCCLLNNAWALSFQLRGHLSALWWLVSQLPPTCNEAINHPLLYLQSTQLALHWFFFISTYFSYQISLPESNSTQYSLSLFTRYKKIFLTFLSFLSNKSEKYVWKFIFWLSTSLPLPHTQIQKYNICRCVGGSEVYR